MQSDQLRLLLLHLYLLGLLLLWLRLLLLHHLLRPVLILQKILLAALVMRVGVTVVVEFAVVSWTLVRSLTRINKYVLLERLQSPKVLWTAFAVILGLTGVRYQMIRQGVGSRKRSRTKLIDVQPFLDVRAHVHLQINDGERF